MTETIAQTKTCKLTGKPFPIYQSDLDFYEKISPTFNGKKFSLPTPTLHPQEREKRRLAFRNERKLYRRTCDFSGKSIISLYSPDKPSKVYDQKIRWSDQRNPMDYGRMYDFSKSFTENFQALLLQVPRVSIINDNHLESQNCEYTNDFVNGKNCYMCFEMGDCEDCLYSHHSNGAKNCIDCDEAIGCTLCYEVMDSVNTYASKYSQGLMNCSDCQYSAFLISCHHCLLCCHRTNLSYGYLNKVLNKAEFNEVITKFQMDEAFRNQALAEFQALLASYPKTNLVFSSTDCSGYNIMYSDRLVECHNSFYSQEVKYGLSLYQVKSCMDLQCRKSELCLEGQTTDECFSSAFCSWSSRSKYLWYCDSCHSSDHLFWCVGLRNKSYCVFNKQYSREEYEKLVASIIEQMQMSKERGEFFHPSLSPFGYNETVANDLYPSNFEQVVPVGFNWSQYEAPQPTAERVILGKDLPMRIEEVGEDILQAVIACEVSGKLFRIQPRELAFYRQWGILLPKKHPDVRNEERIKSIHL